MGTTRNIKESVLFKKLGKFIRVENTASRNGCGSAPNQFELTFENGSAFQSYQTLIAVHYKGEYYFTSSHDCSNTTSSHTGRWCGYNCNERRKGLLEGKFINIVK